MLWPSFAGGDCPIGDKYAYRLGALHVALSDEGAFAHCAFGNFNAKARAMKTIGMLGGMSWESSAVYYQILNREVQKRLGVSHSAKTLMYSFDFEEMFGHGNTTDTVLSAIFTS